MALHPHQSMLVTSTGREHPGVLTIIPARGGSKGVPGKNLRRVGGRSLVERAVDACRAARLVEAVYVSTDDAEIAARAEEAGATVIMRPAELCSDTASSESALLHALDQLIMVGEEPRPSSSCSARAHSSHQMILIEESSWLSVTMPTRSSRPLRPMSSFGEPAAASASLSVRITTLPCGRAARSEPDFRETGAFYVMSTAGFRAARHRFFGRTAAVQVPELTAVDIDHLHDLTLAGALAQVMESPQKIDVDAVITDFDGVHTDDSATIAQDGRESVRVTRADGLGVERLQSVGIPLLIVSKEINPVVAARAAKLGVDVQHGIEDKRTVVRDWLTRHSIPADRAAYLGNDVNDLGPMGLVGWPVAVADAHPAVRQAARLVLARSGGHGAVRELCDLVIEHRQQVLRASITDAGVRGPSVLERL